MLTVIRMTRASAAYLTSTEGRLYRDTGRVWPVYTCWRILSNRILLRAVNELEVGSEILAIRVARQLPPTSEYVRHEFWRLPSSNYRRDIHCENMHVYWHDVSIRPLLTSTNPAWLVYVYRRPSLCTTRSLPKF